ncbi:MAG: hypothetical protein ABIZ81_02985 [Opitutaceae bacterium]
MRRSSFVDLVELNVRLRRGRWVTGSLAMNSAQRCQTWAGRPCYFNPTGKMPVLLRALAAL